MHSNKAVVGLDKQQCHAVLRKSGTPPLPQRWNPNGAAVATHLLDDSRHLTCGVSPTVACCCRVATVLLPATCCHMLPHAATCCYCRAGVVGPKPYPNPNPNSKPNPIPAAGLESEVLAHIWRLSDVGGDGYLDKDEFILAMHLTNVTA